jgi:hypothetical protein
MAPILEGELRQDAGAHQRRLAGPRDAMDQRQPVFPQPVDDLVNHLFPAEENRPFVLLERAQARIGPRGPTDGDWRGDLQAPASNGRL